MAEKKILDIDSFISNLKEAQAAATAKAQAAEAAAKKKKAESAEARNIQSEANNKFQYADALATTLTDYEGQIQAFATKIARGDVLDPIQQRDFDFAIKQYKSVSSTYTKAYNEGTKILEKMPASFKKEKTAIQKDQGIVDETEVETTNPSLTDFLKDAIGSVEKTKKLQQSLKDAGTYTGPVDGIFRAEVLVPAAERAEESLAIYEGLGITFADRFEGYKRLQGSKDGTGGTGNAYAPTGVLDIYTPDKALSYVENLYGTLIGGQIDPKIAQKITDKLIAKQSKMSSAATTTYKMVNGRRVAVQTTGFDEQKFVADELKKIKDPTTGKSIFDQKLATARDTNIQALTNAAKANGVSISKDELDGWAKRIQSGEDVDVFRNIIRQRAAIGQPDSVVKLLNEGTDLEAVYDPYKRSMASILEVNPETIDFNDPTLRNAITKDGTMTLYDYQKSLRKDPRWQYTDNARQTVSTGLTQVLRDFGFMG
jgi:hypothetical protein